MGATANLGGMPSQAGPPARPEPADGAPHQGAPGTAGGGWAGVSVVMPVLDEELHLRAAVRQALAQDYPGKLEVVLALGPSRDRTAEIADRLAASDARVRLVANPTGRTPAGLNAAVAAARYDIIVRLDGHALVSPDYVRVAVEVLAATGAANVGGIMAAEGNDAFSAAVARAMRSPLGVGSAAFHVGGRAGPADSVYLGVFRRSVLAELGGYDERFERAQDWELNYRIRRSGGLVYFTPELAVTYRPRSNLRALGRQYFHYGRWRRGIVRRYPETATVRYLAPPVTLVAVAGGLLLAATGRRLGLLAPVGYAGGVLVGSAWTGRGLPLRGRLALPGIYLTMHGCWAVGFLTSPIRLAAEPAGPTGGGGWTPGLPFPETAGGMPYRR